MAEEDREGRVQAPGDPLAEIAFPKPLRDALEAKWRGEIDQDGLDAACDAWLLGDGWAEAYPREPGPGPFESGDEPVLEIGESNAEFNERHEKFERIEKWRLRKWHDEKADAGASNHQRLRSLAALLRRVYDRGDEAGFARIRDRLRAEWGVRDPLAFLTEQEGARG